MDEKENVSANNSSENTHFTTSIYQKISHWTSEHPGLTTALLVGGSSIVSYKLFQSCISKAVFKGNMKTLRYLNRMY